MAVVVCSARAEMFPELTSTALMVIGLLRTSGDVSFLFTVDTDPTRFAPHERRCFWLKG